MRLEKSQREKLAIFRQVAALLFPTEAPNSKAEEPKEQPKTHDQSPKTTSKNTLFQRISDNFCTVVGTTSSQQDGEQLKDLETIEAQFEEWAEVIEDFVDSINRLPGHTDKDISNRMGMLAIDLKVGYSFHFDELPDNSYSSQ